MFGTKNWVHEIIKVQKAAKKIVDESSNKDISIKKNRRIIQKVASGSTPVKTRTIISSTVHYLQCVVRECKASLT